jgi:NAD(P)-dependent dehydrogenase (short-subunit alcohol dehydrogenase family)
MLDSNRLSGLVAVITGAGGEIGAATARLMAARGAQIVGIDRDAASMTVLGNELGNGFRAVVADVTDEAAVKAYVATALETHGRIDIFFNNAGIEGPVHPIGDYPLDAFRKVVDVNLIGVFLGLKHVVPVMMAAGKGSVINTSSVAGLTGTAGISPYNATKHAVIGITRSVAAEAGPKGVRVNSINPGPIASRMMSSLETGLGAGDATAVHGALQGMIPAGRYGTPEEVAALVAFLGSEDSRYINGAVMTVDGGFTVG